jgi:hypothetical protein
MKCRYSGLLPVATVLTARLLSLPLQLIAASTVDVPAHRTAGSAPDLREPSPDRSAWR